MIWKRFSIETTVETEELLVEFLDELGFPGAEIQDSQPLTEEEMKQMYVDVPLIPEDDGERAIVSIYLDESVTEERIEKLKEEVAEELSRLSEFMSTGTGMITVSETTDDSTWQDNWKNYYQPFRLGEDILICPAWIDLPLASEKQKTDDSDKPDQSITGGQEVIRPEDKVVKIASVTAFGTGTHETTKLCIKNLRKYLKEGQSVFDVGCGSGILAILSVLLGAGYVHGLDIDPQAVLSSRENAEANGLSEDRISFSSGNLLAGNVIGAMTEEEKEEYKKASMGSGVSAVNPVQLVDLSLGEPDTVEARKYDIVVANILADVIIPLAAVVPDYLVSGGLFISSGIMEDRSQDVQDALLAAGFEILEVEYMGEWTAVVARM